MKRIASSSLRGVFTYPTNGGGENRHGAKNFVSAGLLQDQLLDLARGGAGCRREGHAELDLRLALAVEGLFGLALRLDEELDGAWGLAGLLLLHQLLAAEGQGAGTGDPDGDGRGSLLAVQLGLLAEAEDRDRGACLRGGAGLVGRRALAAVGADRAGGVGGSGGAGDRLPVLQPLQRGGLRRPVEEGLEQVGGPGARSAGQGGAGLGLTRRLWRGEDRRG